MATYANQADFEGYVEGWVTSDPAALERLLERAEKDIDRILTRTEYPTNSIFGISLSGANGGSFNVTLTWGGVNYTASAIPWNTSGPTVLSYLLGMTDQYGNALPNNSVWNIPEASYYSQPWAYGPLPNTPIVVEAYNQLGRQKLVMTADGSNLTGTQPTATITEIVRGGLRINPYFLSAYDNQKLKDATCAQAEYRNTMGEEFFRRAQWSSVSGPEFKTTGKLPLIGPKVMTELSGTDLVQRGARARPGTIVGRQIVYVPAGTTPIPDDWVAP